MPKDTFDTAVLEGVSKGFLPESALESIEEAEMYKGLSKGAGTLDLLDGLYRVAKDHEPVDGSAPETRYEKDLMELTEIWRRWNEDNT